MNYHLDTFRDLLGSYPTWESLHSVLTEGGAIRCVGEGRYRILRHGKGPRDITTPYGPWMRSVIWDTEAHLPVCVAPPKAESTDVKTGEGISYPLVQHFLDGIMINVFRTYSDPSTLQIATRTQLGATSTFYSERTFAEMVEDALMAMGSSRTEILSHLAQPTEMVPNHFASFVLQHPEHHVVTPCSSPHLYLVHTGAVHDDGSISLNEHPEHWPSKWQIPVVPSESVHSPAFSAMCTEKGWSFQGLTLKDGKGHRWRLRNPAYMALRSLRGSEAPCIERFLRLRSEHKGTEYLTHYPEDRQAFWDLEQALRLCTQEVYQGYCDVHKSRSKKLGDLKWSIRPCVFKLHSQYLEQLRPNTENVYMKHAVEVVNNLALYEQKRLLMPTK